MSFYDYFSRILINGVFHHHVFCSFVFLNHPQTEPARRAREELGVKALVTGLYNSSSAYEANQTEILEIDESGLVRVNPLAKWTWEETWAYVKAHDVPYNPLLNHGYRSIGDWHSTPAPIPHSTPARGEGWHGSTSGYGLPRVSLDGFSLLCMSSVPCLTLWTYSNLCFGGLL